LKPIPLSHEEVAILDAATELPCVVTKWDVAWKLKHGLWHVLTIPELYPLYRDEALKEMILGVATKRASRQELVEGLAHPSSEVRLMCQRMMGRMDPLART
jgi:hypothetical protein